MALDDQTAWDTSDDTTAQGQQTQLPGGIVSPAGSMDINGLLRQVMAQQPVQLPQMPTRSPSDGTSPGWLGLLGEALAGGQSPLYKLRGAQEDTAGSRALLNFGINMMMASGPSPVKPSLFSAAAQGLQGAQQSMDASQGAAYTQAGQQFEQQKALAQLGIQQQDVRIKQLAAALPFLRLQQMAGIPNPLAPNAPGTTAPGGYAGWIAGIEGPGKNPASSAQGYGQFTDATWNEFVQANPQMFAGMTPQQIQAARSDPTIGTNAINWLAQRNAGALKNLGAPATAQSLGIAHFLGAGAAAAVMNAPDGMPVSAFVSPEAVKANPQLASMTVGQLKQRYANGPAPAFLGGTQYAGPGVPPASGTTTPAPAAPAAPPGVQVGGAVPAPPGGTGGATTAYPASGGGIGRVLSGTQGVPGSQPVTVRPPPSPNDIRVSPTLRIGNAAGGVPIASNAPIAPAVGPALPPSPAVAGYVQAMLGGMQGARPTLAGGTATAGPGAGPAPVGGFGAIGDYNNAPAATARPATPATPPVVPPAPTTATTPPTTTPAPGAKLSFEDWQAQHPIKVDPSLYTVTPPDLTKAVAAENAAAQTLELIHQGLSTADPNKATQAYNDAANNVARLQQEADAKSLELRQSAQKNALDTQRQLYDAEMQRQQQEVENQKNRDAEIRKAELAAGYTATQKQADADIDIAKNDLNDRAAEAQKAARIIPVLKQIQGQFGNLPDGFIGGLLAKYDTTGDLTGVLSKMGVVDPSKATAAQLLIAARNYLSIETKPVASGSLRVPEMDKLQAYTPGQLQTPQAQQEMAARLIAYQQRIEDERTYAGNYFGRLSNPSDPNSKRIYDNRGLDAAMNAPPQYDQNGVVTGGGLGPVVPEPPALNAPDSEHQAYLNYVNRNVKPGMPYQTWAPKTNPDGSTAVDQNGKPIPQRVTRLKSY